MTEHVVVRYKDGHTETHTAINAAILVQQVPGWSYEYPPKQQSDQIEQPAHYQVAPGVEVIQLTRHMDFLTGNVIKYVARAGKKPGNSKLQDLKKAQVYLRILIEDAASEDAAQWAPDKLEN